MDLITLTSAMFADTVVYMYPDWYLVASLIFGIVMVVAVLIWFWRNR